MKDIKVSIVTVCYNADSCLELTIKSVISQDFKNFEYLLIDGGSTDKTLDVIKKYESVFRYWISEPDNGIYSAMNKGLLKAEGEWIIFMNAGDTFNSDKTLSEVFSNYSLFKDANFVYGDVNLIGEKGVSFLNQSHKNIKYQSVCHQSQFIRLEEIKKFMYDPSYKIFGDYDFQLKVFSKNVSKMIYLPITIANYNLFGISMKPFYKMFQEYIRVVNRNVPMYKRFGFYSYGIISSIKSILFGLINNRK